MQLYFIRHAQSENNVLLERTGSDDGRDKDPELTDLGYRQAKILAEFLSRSKQAQQKNSANDSQNIQGVHLTHLYTSLMVRAVATGAEISRSTGLPLIGWPELHEVGGIYQKNSQTGIKEGQPGNTKTYLIQRFPALFLPCPISEEGWWNRPHEDAQAGQNRARAVYQQILSRHSGSEDRIGLISHGDFYRLFLSVLFDLTSENPASFELNNAAMTRIDFSASNIRIVYLNRLDYLPVELIT